MSVIPDRPEPGPALPPAAQALRLRDLLAGALADLAQGREAWGLLDFPYHNNTGDSAIWVGERTLLRRLHGRASAYVSHARFDPAEAGRFVPPEGILYLHGGGNFGDLWPGHQLYREAVLARHPHHRIVQLPQSLHYADPAAIERTRRAVAGHRDFHLMVRDQQSHDFAQRHFDCNVVRAPDSAFAIDLARFALPERGAGLLCLFRSDHEKRADAADGPAAFAGERIEDWSAMGKGIRPVSRQVMRVVRRTLPVPGWMALRGLAFDRMAGTLVGEGLAQLGRGRVVVTDRLHGHILAEILGLPHVVIDNFYGKIAGFIGLWGASAVAADYRAARQAADALLAAAE